MIDRAPTHRGSITSNALGLVVCVVSVASGCQAFTPVRSADANLGAALLQIDTIWAADGGFEVRSRFEDRIETTTHFSNGLIRSRSTATAVRSGEAPSPEPIALAAAAALVSSEGELARIWPGYWDSNHAFGIFPVFGMTMVVFPPHETGPGAVLASNDVPAELRGRAYLIEEVPSPPFDLAFAAGGKTIASAMVAPPPSRSNSDSASVLWLGDPVAYQVMFIAHESFHTYQIASFLPVRGGNPLANLAPVLSYRHLLSDLRVVASLQAERQTLRSALLAQSEDEARSLIGAYAKLKRDRLAGMPDPFGHFENAHERMEGVAQWVGYRAVAIAMNFEARVTLELLAADLEGSWANVPADGWDGYWQWHLYATGAAKAELLSRIGHADWQLRVEQGSSLDELLQAVTL
jgi:hypothetical protein